jgi:hypothetical protein
MDYLFLLVIQDDGFDINLHGDETIRSDDREETVQGIETYHQAKHLIIILSLNLGKSLYHISTFEFVDRSARKALNFKAQFRIYNISVSRSVNYIPSMVTLKNIHFTLDSRIL